MKYIDELYRTPEILARTMGTAKGAVFADNRPLVLCGCGTSFYLAGMMARLCAAAGKNAWAAEAVEVIEAEELSYPAGAVFVFISRSGSSMETVLAQRRAKAEGYATFYLGCTRDSALGRGCDEADVMPFANEALILESYSFYAQALRLAICCGLYLPPDIPDRIKSALSCSEKTYSNYFADAKITRMISLGAPFYMPLMKEMMLKNGEITQKSSELWGILEFRHGPRSWADESCMISVVPGKKTFDYDINAARELVGYGCRVVWFGGEKLDGAVCIDTGEEKYSTAESLWLGAFMTGIASRIGESCGVDASALRNVVHNVGRL